MKIDAPTITKIANLTSNGYVAVSGSVGTLAVKYATDPLYQNVAYHAASMTSAAASRTTGAPFAVRILCTITGATFRTGIATNPHTMRVKLWNPAGTSVATVDVVCAGAGQYTGVFSSAYTVPAAYVGDVFRISVWETTGTDYSYCSAAPSVPAPGAVGRAYYVQTPNVYAAGDANPTTTHASQWYVIDPTIVPV
jgi:hypothetical protein